MPQLENGNVVKINENVGSNSNVTKPVSLNSVKNNIKSFTSKIAVKNVKIIKKDGTLEDYNMNDGGYDGEVYELLYLKGNGNYIVITDCAE